MDEWAIVYIAAGICFVAWGWRDVDAEDIRPLAIAVAIAFVVTTWPVGLVVRTRNLLERRRFRLALAQAIEARQGQDRNGLDRNDESAVATPCAQGEQP